MKKLFLLSLLVWSFTTSFGQVSINPNNIGVGPTTSPLVPLHINKNGELARFQGTWPYISFYDGSNMNGYLQAINSTFEIGSKNYYDLNFFTGDVPRVNINGSTGMVTVNQKLIAQNGFKLTGPLQAESESVGADGMVLVSKGNATPAWEDRRVYFKTTFPSGIFNLNSTSTYIFTTYNELQDLNYNFNPATGIFTAPATGLYQFDWKFTLGNPDSNPTINEASLTFIVRRNGVDTHRVKYHHTNLVPNFTYPSDNLGLLTIYLNANDQISFGVTQSNNQGQVLNIFTNGSERDIKISGHRIF